MGFGGQPSLAASQRAKAGSGGGSCTHGGKAYEASLCALDEFHAIDFFFGSLRIPIKVVTGAGEEMPGQNLTSSSVQKPSPDVYL